MRTNPWSSVGGPTGQGQGFYCQNVPGACNYISCGTDIYNQMNEFSHGLCVLGQVSAGMPWQINLRHAANDSSQNDKLRSFFAIKNPLKVSTIHFGRKKDPSQWNRSLHVAWKNFNADLLHCHHRLLGGVYPRTSLSHYLILTLKTANRLVLIGTLVGHSSRKKIKEISLS